MGVAVWAALRQIEALRESIAFTLENLAIQKHGKFGTEGFARWISEQGVTPVFLTPRDFETDQQIGEESVDLLLSMERFIEDRYPYAKAAKSEMRYSRYDEPDFGVHRSGVGWNKLPNFVVTSAFVRLLGASEQYELDVLKSLLYYRAAGKPDLLDNNAAAILTSEVLTEEPDESGAYSKPPIWTWIKKFAENNVERKKILSRVYGIETIPKEFNGLNKAGINKYRDELYENRNAIAHGRKNIEMLLSNYCTAELFVIEAIRTVARQCADNLQVIL